MNKLKVKNTKTGTFDHNSRVYTSRLASLALARVKFAYYFQQSFDYGVLSVFIGCFSNLWSHKKSRLHIFKIDYTQLTNINS